MKTGPEVQFRIENMKVVIGSRICLSVRSLEIERGERVAFLGPSGSGKTTLLSVLSGIRTPTSGLCDFEGLDLSGLSEGARDRLRTRNFGMVFQTGGLLEASTVRMNIILPLLLTGRPRGPARAWAEALLERVNLPGRGDDLPSNLSEGERQRVAVARAVALRPRVILADEPTGALDPENRETILDLLDEFSSEAGSTLLVVTHEEETAARFARRVGMEDLC